MKIFSNSTQPQSISIQLRLIQLTMTATQLLVVPKSIPMTSPASVLFQRLAVISFAPAAWSMEIFVVLEEEDEVRSMYVDEIRSPEE